MTSLRHIRWPVVCLTTLVLIAASPARHALRSAPDPLAPFAFLVGGVWDGRGTWPDGSPLHVELHYSWGATQRLLHFTTHEWSGTRREPLYEGIVFYDPTRSAVFQWNVKTDGSITESRIAHADSSGYAVVSPNTRSTIQRTGPDEMHWILQIPMDSTWHTIMDAPHRRR